VLAAAERIPESKAVVTIGSPASPEHVVALFGADVERIEEEGKAEAEEKKPDVDLSQIEGEGEVLTKGKAGKIFLNDSEVAIEDLEARITKVLPEMKKGAIILKADQDVSHGLVVRLMDIVKKSGVKKLVIGTKLK